MHESGRSIISIKMIINLDIDKKLRYWQTNKESMQGSKQANKKWCSRRTYVSLDFVSVVPSYWNTNETCTIKKSS